jgi:hypothetical protein
MEKRGIQSMINDEMPDMKIFYIEIQVEL